MTPSVAASGDTNPSDATDWGLGLGLQWLELEQEGAACNYSISMCCLYRY